MYTLSDISVQYQVRLESCLGGLDGWLWGVKVKVKVKKKLAGWFRSVVFKRNEMNQGPDLENGIWCLAESFILFMDKSVETHTHILIIYGGCRV